MIEGIDWKLVAILIPITMALTEWIKSFFMDKTTGVCKLGQWAILISMAFAFLTVFLFGIDTNAFVLLPFIKMSIMVGLGAAGLYNGTTQIGYALNKTLKDN